MRLTHEDRKIIRELSRTIYDSWVAPPPMESLTHLLTLSPKNYETVSIDELHNFVMENLKKNESLISKLSDKNLKQLSRSIRSAFGDINFMDLEHGGDGLIKPTFMEIMSKYIFIIRDHNFTALISKEDKLFYHKYFWCFDHHSKLTSNQMNKAS